MAGFLAALAKSVGGLSDAGYKAQEEFLTRDWMNRRNLQQEQIGNVGMEATRANIANAASRLALEREQETRLAAEAAQRLEAGKRAAAEAIRLQNVAAAERSGYPVAPGAPNMLLENVAPSTEQPAPSVVPAAGGAPIATAPTQAPVVAPPTSSVVSVGRSATGAGFPSVQLTPAPVQTPVPPPPTAVAPAQPVQEPIRTQAGTQYRPTPQTMISHIQPVTAYTIPAAALPDGSVRPARPVSDDEAEGYERNFRSRIDEYFKLATLQGMTPDGVATYIELINREADQFKSSLGGMRPDLLAHVTGQLAALKSMHPVMIRSAVQADEDSAMQRRRDEAYITSLQNRGSMTPTQLEAQRRRDREDSVVQMEGVLSPKIATGEMTFEEASTQLRDALEKAVADGNMQQEDYEYVYGKVISKLLNYRRQNISEVRGEGAIARAEAAAARAEASANRTQDPNYRTPTQARSEENARAEAATNTRSSLNEMSSIARTMTDNGINVQHIITDVKPEAMSEQDWKLLRTRWLRGVWKSNPTNPEYPSGWRASVGG